MFHRKGPLREESMNTDKATLYGVVSPELVEKIYENLYTHSLLLPPGGSPRYRILRYRTVTGFESSPSGTAVVRCKNATSLYEKSAEPLDEKLEFDAVILATGYTRDIHLNMLKPLERLLAQNAGANGGTKWSVAEDYAVSFDSAKVDRSQAGVWLQGCNEKTHGVSYHLWSTPGMKYMG